MLANLLHSSGWEKWWCRSRLCCLIGLCLFGQPWSRRKHSNGPDSDSDDSQVVLPWLWLIANLSQSCAAANVTVFLPSYTSLVTLAMLTFPSTAQPVHLFLSPLYSFALLSTATRIASLFLFHPSYVLFPSSYAVPLGLCASSCSINISSVLM